MACAFLFSFLHRPRKIPVCCKTLMEHTEYGDVHANKKLNFLTFFGIKSAFPNHKMLVSPLLQTLLEINYQLAACHVTHVSHYYFLCKRSRRGILRFISSLWARRNPTDQARVSGRSNPTSQAGASFRYGRHRPCGIIRIHQRKKARFLPIPIIAEETCARFLLAGTSILIETTELRKYYLQGRTETH
jgi:hypothetical protein